jgi:nucleotide-binding universal stress UspA family protein
MSASNRFVMVVGVDFSKTGDLAFDRALELGTAASGSELHLVNVVRTYGAGVQLELPGSPGFTTMSLGEAAEQLRQYAEQRLAAFSGSKHQLPRVVTHVRLDAPAEEIAQLAADLEADLVIVGTHGRRGLSRVLMGSIAEGVVRLAPCTVLVVRPKAIAAAPHIEPPCPDCVEARRQTHGQEFWCERHRERHGQRHTYFSNDRVSQDGTMPLVFPER